MKNRKIKPLMGISLLLLLLFSACKLELDQEVWLNADNSGRAKLVAVATTPRLTEDEEESNSMGLDNALQDYADRAYADGGAKVTLFESRTDHNPDEYCYIYELEFSFDDLQTLRNVICIDSTKGFNVEQTKSYKLADINPHNFYMQEDSEIQEYLSMMDIEMNLVLHLPSEPKRIDTKDESTSTGKDISWKFILDQEWYNRPEQNILIMF